MMLKADNVFQKLVNEYNINNAFRTQLLEIVAFLGYFRWYNEKNDWYNENGEQIGFTFTGLQLNKFYANNKLDKQNLVEQVIKQSKQAPEMDSNQIIDAITRLKHNTHDIWQVCNGHDCIKVLAAHINQVNFGKKSINYKDLEQSIRFAYHITDFKQRILYKNTQTWATANNCILYKS
jgi:TusA-related sulfurtransferase